MLFVAIICFFSQLITEISDSSNSSHNAWFITVSLSSRRYQCKIRYANEESIVIIMIVGFLCSRSFVILQTRRTCTTGRIVAQILPVNLHISLIISRAERKKHIQSNCESLDKPSVCRLIKSRHYIYLPAN